MKCIGSKFRFTLLIPHARSKEGIQTDSRVFFGRSYPIIVFGAERQQALHIRSVELVCNRSREIVAIQPGLGFRTQQRSTDRIARSSSCNRRGRTTYLPYAEADGAILLGRARPISISGDNSEDLLDVIGCWLSRRLFRIKGLGDFMEELVQPRCGHANQSGRKR